MNATKKQLSAWALALAGLTVGSATNCLAQGELAGGSKVPGTQLQTWLAQQFNYAGFHHPSQCVIMNVAQSAGRMLFIRCPNGWAEKFSGSARVVGDEYCTTFPMPSSPGEDCVTWYAAGQGRFEQRKGSELNTSVIVLPDGLSAKK